jgi:hypothetical protein
VKNKLVVVMFVLCLITSAIAQTDTATGTSTDDATMARLRVAYIVFGGPNVDILIDGEIAKVGAWEQADLSCCGVTGYTYLAPGTHSVEVAPTGKGVEDALLSADVKLEAGHRYTLATMGQIEDKSLTPLVIDETTAVREARTDPSQEIIILVNNLKGAKTFSFTVDGQGIHDIPYGGFAAAPNPMSAAGDFEFSANGGKDILDAAQNQDYPVTPGIDFMHLRFGHLPGTWGEDHSDTQGMPVTELKPLEFLQNSTGPEGQQNRTSSSYNTFLKAVEKAGLTDMLETNNPYWLLPPTDEAFATFPQERLDAVMADPEALADLVRNHIAKGYFPDLPDPAANMRGIKLEGIQWQDLYLSTNGSHVSPISTVLLPPDEACRKAQAAQVNFSPRSLEDHIVSMWLFDEGQGDRAGDASGHGHHGTFVNAAWDKGKFGSAAHIIPGENYVEVETTDETLSPAKEMTITAWVYLAALPDLEEQFPNRRILEASTYNPAEFWSGGGDNHYGLHFQWGSFIFRPGRHAFPDRVGIDQSEAIEPGRWQHIAGVYSGDHIRLYVNGELRSETEANCMTLTQPPDNRLFIGTKAPEAPDGDWWDGHIDEVAIFDVALNKEEIGTVMQGLGTMRAD